MENYKFKIEFITPLHIGDGEEIDPLNYIVKNNYFFRINLEKFIFELSNDDRKVFTNLIDSKKIIELRNYIKENCDCNKYSFYKGKVSRNFKDSYKKGFADKENSLIIKSFTKTSSMLPFIPGSSLKGSIRTAVLNYLLLNNKKEILKIDFLDIRDSRGKKIWGPRSNIIESTILGMPNRRLEPKFDPFRFLYISDYLLKENNLFIGQAENIRLERSNVSDDVNSWQMFYEVPLNVGGDSNNIGELTIINERFEKLKVYKNYLKSIERITDFNLIKKACRWFYKKIAFEEYNKFYKNNKNYCGVFNKVNSEFEKLKENEIILRCGKNSHFESMTLIGFEDLKPKKYGKSRNIFENKLPMGWLKIIFC